MKINQKDLFELCKMISENKPIEFVDVMLLPFTGHVVFQWQTKECGPLVEVSISEVKEIGNE